MKWLVVIILLLSILSLACGEVDLMIEGYYGPRTEKQDFYIPNSPISPISPVTTPTKTWSEWQKGCKIGNEPECNFWLQ